MVILNETIENGRKTDVMEMRKVMFEKGEYIVYGTSGVCEVTDIKNMDLKGIPKDKLFYVLTPYNQKSSTLFTQVDSTKTVMRKVLTKEQALELIDSMPEVEELYFANEKVREEKYKECIRSCDCEQCIRVIKTLYLRRDEKIAQGKKFAATDERYLKLAEDNLYSELSVALGMTKKEVQHYIEEKLGILILA